MNCANCQEPIKAHWHYCRWCGTALQAASAPAVHQNNRLDNIFNALAAYNASQHSQPGAAGGGHHFDNIDDAVAWIKYGQ